MSEWSKVVTDPLGLAGFALFLVFGLFAKLKRRDERRWLTPLAVLMAVSALVGGIFLSYRKSSQTQVSAPTQATAPGPKQQQSQSEVIQHTTGQGSPAVQGVQGDVTITIDQSSGSTKQKPAAEEKRPAEKNP